MLPNLDTFARQHSGFGFWQYRPVVLTPSRIDQPTHAMPDLSALHIFGQGRGVLTMWQCSGHAPGLSAVNCRTMYPNAGSNWTSLRCGLEGLITFDPSQLPVPTSRTNML